MTKNVLFISHPQRQCGVHEFGKNIADVIKRSARYNFIYIECGGFDDLHKAISLHQPVALIYNYHPSTLPWLTEKIIHTKYRPLNRNIHLPQIEVMHEVTQGLADRCDNHLFDYHIAADPTLLLENPLVFKTGRLVPPYNNSFPVSPVPVIGSFGFATPNKGFERIVKAVQDEFDTAIIRFNIPAADFGDSDGSNAAKLAAYCRQLITKPGIELRVTHHFLNQQQILDFLAENTVNVFLYEDKTGRGLSSTIDYALAVDRPVAVSDSIMFRHVHNLEPPIVYGPSTLKQIIQNGIAPLQKVQQEWDAVHLVWEFERIMDAILKKEEQKKNKPVVSDWKKIKTSIRGLLGLKKQPVTWLRNTSAAVEDVLTVDRSQSYSPVVLPAGAPLNRILDNSARSLYGPAIDKLTELVPITMSKKIAAANVQQGFVFDTVYRFLKNYSSPTILCVGSYEDTAAMSLKRLGYKIDEIDPVLNYYLQEFVSKPGIAKRSYDIIFSTSVIEHDPDDESFIRAINELLAPGGVAVITCDYKDQWKPGDPLPEVDCRFYTQRDLRNRLLPLMTDCVLADDPQWDCEAPDFNYLGKYQYTFATMVVKKVNK
jgi:SAM-dependent methyltransferase